MGEADWAADPEFDTMEKRAARRPIVDARVGGWTGRYTMAELRDRLDRAEVPNSPIASVADIFEDPHYAARETLIPIEDPVVGSVRMHAPVARLSETPARVPGPAPEIGEHNAEVYGGELGFSAEELDRLRQQGVI